MSSSWRVASAACPSSSAAFVVFPQAQPRWRWVLAKDDACSALSAMLLGERIDVVGDIAGVLAGTCATPVAIGTRERCGNDSGSQAA